MGTRSTIGYALTDDSIVSVYCHYDGYPEFNGKVLNEYYTNVDKVRELLDGGDMSSLRTDHGWNNETLSEVGPLRYTSRGENIKDVQPEYSKDLDSYLKHCDDVCGEYAYVFKNNKWHCYQIGNPYSDRKHGAEIPIPAGSVNDK